MSLWQILLPQNISTILCSLSPLHVYALTSKQNRRKECLAIFWHEAATLSPTAMALYHKQLCSDIAKFFELQLGKYSIQL